MHQLVSLSATAYKHERFTQQTVLYKGRTNATRQDSITVDYRR